MEEVGAHTDICLGYTFTLLGWKLHDTRSHKRYRRSELYLTLSDDDQHQYSSFQPWKATTHIVNTTLPPPS
jgi:hypothetical protein